MKIGIDARFLTHPQRGGFKTYTTNLLLAMSEVDDYNQYYVYLDRPLGDNPFPQGNNWHPIEVHTPRTGIGMPVREQLLLREQFNKDRLDIVHFLCNTATVKFPNPYVVTLHDTIQIETKNKFKLLRRPSLQKQWAIMLYSRWAINHSIYSADRIITVSSFEKKRIGEWFNIPKERIVPIHLAPNPIFKPASPSEKNIWRTTLMRDFGIHNRYILGIGWEPRKNIELLISAFSGLIHLVEDLSLVIVCAEENKRSFLRELVEKLGFSERVYLLASQSTENLAVLYNLAEVFVYPSERESFGLPPLEALSCGVPTIAMNNSSVPEILDDGALLVEGKDVQGWTDAILKIIGDHKASNKLIRQGLNRASMFSWQKCAGETIQVYTDVFQGHSRRQK